jgi:hypothetical protein
MEKIYALRLKTTKKLIGFITRYNNGADFATDVEFILDAHVNNVWTINDYKTALSAAETSSEWYNAYYDSPSNDYVGELEVVELKVI